MLSTPLEMRKVGLYMVDADAQSAALALARMRVLHPLEDSASGQVLQDYPAAAYQAVYHDLNSRFGKISSFLQTPLQALIESDELVTLINCRYSIGN